MSDLHTLCQRWDAIVIGGGPAGSVVALGLVRLGWRVLLVDKGPHGRSKCCGHCLNPRVKPTLERLGLLRVITGASVGRTQGLRLHLHRRDAIEIPFVDGELGWITPRESLDAALLDEARRLGVVVAHNTSATVETLSESDSTVRVRKDSVSRLLRAGLVVGADGLNSAVAKAANLSQRTQAGRKYGFSMSESGLSAHGVHRQWVDMFTAPDGYLGVVNTASHRVHCAALVTPRSRRRRLRPATFLTEIKRRFPALGDVKTAPSREHKLIAAGPMPCRPRAAACAGVALVGDAAGYVEPITGEGIACAIESSAMLVETLLRQTPGRFSTLEAEEYTRRWRRATRSSLRRCAAIAWTMERPALLHFLRLSNGFGVRIDGALARRITRTGAIA